MKHFTQTLKVLILGIVLSFGLSYIHAWSGPSTTPPLVNVAAPINVSNSTQYKLGELFVNTLTSTTTNSNPYGIVAFGESIFVSNVSNQPAIEINDGTAAAGKVLTASDASGTAYWAMPTSSGNASGTCPTAKSVVGITAGTLVCQELVPMAYVNILVDTSATIDMSATSTIIEAGGGASFNSVTYPTLNGIPLATSTLALYNVTGRNAVTITQQPTQSNGYVAKIYITDPQGGDSNYSFEVGYQTP